MQMMAERTALAVVEGTFTGQSVLLQIQKTLTPADKWTQLVCALWLCMTINIGANLWIMSFHYVNECIGFRAF